MLNGAALDKSATRQNAKILPKFGGVATVTVMDEVLSSHSAEFADFAERSRLVGNQARSAITYAVRALMVQRRRRRAHLDVSQSRLLPGALKHAVVLLGVVIN